QYLASGSTDGVIKLWDAHTGQSLRTFRIDKKMVFSLAFSPSEGNRLASAWSDGWVRIWDMQADKKIREWQAHSSPVGCVVFSPDGRRLVSSRLNYGWEEAPSIGEAKVWDAATGDEIFALKEQPRDMLRVAFSPDGGRLATAGQDGTVKVWEATTG